MRFFRAARKHFIWLALVMIIALVFSGCNRPPDPVKNANSTPGDSSAYHQDPKPSSSNPASGSDNSSGPGQGGVSNKPAGNNTGSGSLPSDSGTPPVKQTGSSTSKQASNGDSTVLPADSGSGNNAGGTVTQNVYSTQPKKPFNPQQPELMELKLGQSDQMVLQLYGKPTKEYVMEDPKYPLTIYQYSGFMAGFSTADELRFVSVDSGKVNPGLNGVRVGYNVQSAIKKLGKPKQQNSTSLIYLFNNTLIRMDLDPHTAQIIAIKLFVAPAGVLDKGDISKPDGTSLSRKAASTDLNGGSTPNTAAGDKPNSNQPAPASPPAANNNSASGGSSAGSTDTGSASGGSSAGSTDTGSASGGSSAGSTDTGSASGGSSAGSTDTGSASGGSSAGSTDTGSASGGSSAGSTDTGSASGGSSAGSTDTGSASGGSSAGSTDSGSTSGGSSAGTGDTSNDSGSSIMNETNTGTL